MAENSSKKPTLLIILVLVAVAIIIGIILLFELPKANAAAPTSTIEASATLAPTEAVDTATPLPTNTEIPTQTAVPPTATALPTETPLPSPTAIPALAVNPDGFSAWCYPDEQITAPPSGKGISKAPEGSNKSTVVDGVPNVPIPGYSCNYVFEFNQPAPEGLKVEIYDWLQKKPAFNLPLDVASDNPNAAVLSTTNTYLSKRIFWEYTYKFIVKDKDGNELWNNPVKLNVPWRPAICLAGVYPKASSLRCPLRQDSHPWDPWYGKTPVPNDDEHPIP
jgi:hypothetical protein